MAELSFHKRTNLHLYISVCTLPSYFPNNVVQEHLKGNLDISARLKILLFCFRRFADVAKVVK